jgi:hypothetical protein
MRPDSTPQSDRTTIPARRCLVIGNFVPSPTGDGGQRRSWQIQRHLEAQGFDCHRHVMTVPGAGTKLWSMVRLGVRAAWRMRQAGFSLRGLPQLAASYMQLGGLDPASYDRVVIEATNHPGAAVWANWHATRTEAYPHNVETLANPVVGMPPRAELLGWRLADEVNALRLVEQIHCICAEDAWFFAQFGIQADTIPYVSPETGRRAAQPGLRRHRILVPGSATNPPTAHGLERVLRHAPRIGGVVYTVIGAGTETLARRCVREDVEFLGRVSSDRLDELQAESRVALCYQEYGTGVLTRIADLLARGMVVWASTHAARGYPPQERLHIFREWLDFERGMAAEEYVK